MRSKSPWAAVAALVAGLIVVNASGAATATTVTLTVNSTADNSAPCTIVNHKSTGTCTLRGAILAAGAYGQDNTRFAIRLKAKTYSLSLGTLDVSAASAGSGNVVQIIGATTTSKKTPASIIDGSDNSTPSSVFVVDSPTQMLNVVITGGRGDPHLGCTGCGGGIVLQSALDLQNAVVRNNTACETWVASSCTGPYSYGGGIYMPAGPDYESLTLFKTTVTHNTAGGGGGIENDDTAHSLILAMQSHIDKNTACATFSHGACVDFGFGGGLGNEGGQVTLDDSTVNGNVAGSAAYEDGDGGGIYESSDNMQLNHTNVNGNTAGFRGGGVYDGGNVDFVDSAVSSNIAGTEGGGVYVVALASFDHTTISSNTAGGTFACTVGATTSCAHTIGTTTGDCATLYPSATACFAASGMGGGVMGDEPSSPEFVSSTVTRNLAASIAGSALDCGGGRGGGVFSDWTLTVLAGTRITQNGADCGGGIYNVFSVSEHGATFPFALANSTVAGNTALEDGAGIWTMGSGTGTLYGMRVTGNHAGRQTGGLWDDELGSVFLGAHNTITNNTGTGACANVTWPCS